MNCDKCKQIKVKNKDIFSCDGCSRCICKECGNLTASEVKVLQLMSGRVMKFYCPKCISGESLSLFQQMLDDKEVIIEDKTKIINLLEAEIDKLKSNIEMEEHSYSRAVKKQKHEVILVKPKDCSQTSENTKKIIEEKINPCDLGVGVSRVKFVREGGVAIKCNENIKNNMESLCSSIKQSLGQSYEVKIPEKLNPRIIIFNVNEVELQNEDIFLNKITIQNTISTDTNIKELKIVHRYKNRKGLMNVIIQLDVKSYECIILKEKICIGWRTYFYKDSFNIKQCFNCWKFGHIAKECKREQPTCQNCAGDHKEVDCKASEVCCVNCKYALEVLKIPSVDCRHKAYDRTCEAYKRVFKQLQEKVNYPDLHTNRSKI